MKKTILLLIILTLNTHLAAMEENALITYRRATQEDVGSLLYLINTHAIHDNDKIVVVPEKFRQSALEEDIQKKKIYIAQKNDTNEIIALKKLYRIDTEEEYKDITRNEIRCKGKAKSCVGVYDIGLYKHENPPLVSFRMNQMFAPQYKFSNSCPLYFGGDFTTPSERGKKINSQLTHKAFELIKDDVIQAIKAKNDNLTSLVLLYGLTKTNAGENNGINRTPSIVKTFIPFAREVQKKCNLGGKNSVTHARYHSCMPTFDPNSEEYKPLPEEQCVLGYGNVLHFELM